MHFYRRCYIYKYNSNSCISWLPPKDAQTTHDFYTEAKEVKCWNWFKPNQVSSSNWFSILNLVVTDNHTQSAWLFDEKWSGFTLQQLWSVARYVLLYIIYVFWRFFKHFSPCVFQAFLTENTCFPRRKQLHLYLSITDLDIVNYFQTKIGLNIR